jgi:predicted transposase YbfD/YdcC
MDSSTKLQGDLLGEQGYILDLDELFARFSSLADKRHARGKRYDLAVLLMIATLAKLAGCQHTAAIADWARLRSQALARLFRLPRASMPSLSTWNRVFGQAVDVEELERIISDYLCSVVQREPLDGYCCAAIDGKTLRGTLRIGQRGVHLLAIYLPHEGLVLAQVEIDVKANEISAAPGVLAQADLTGLVITADAMFTQRYLCLQIVAAQADYIMQVKENQPRLLEDIKMLFTPRPPIPGSSQVPTDFSTATHKGKGHGRIEVRTITVSSMLQGYSEWPHLAQVFRIENLITQTTTGKKTQAVRYGITSLRADQIKPEQLLDLTRRHWGIESGLHYRRDVVLGEDRCRVSTGHAAHVHAALNNFVVAFLHHCQARSMAQSLRQTTYCIEHGLNRLCLS